MPPKEQIQASINTYLTPILIVLVGYFLNAKIQDVDKRIERMEETKDIMIELRQRVNDMERRLGQVEDHKTSTLYRHEEIFYLNTPKTVWA